MNLLFAMIAISIVLALGFLLAFLWANKNKQFDDLVTPSWRILFDDTKEQVREEQHVGK